MNNETLTVFLLGWVFLLAAWLVKGKTEKRVVIKLMLATARPRSLLEEEFVL